MNDEPKTPPAPEVPPSPAPPAAPAAPGPAERFLVVRYGKSIERRVFSTTLADLGPGEPCIVRTNRGTEHGRVVETVPRASPEGVEGRVLRRPTPEDLVRIAALEKDPLEKEFRFCRQKIVEHGLEMKLVDVERILGGEKILFFFTANGRVDFRALVKSLAQEYRMRIELKQIGVRDEAKVVGTVSHCGRELCCRGFMRNIEQVTMKMAKVQKSTLDPTKISGRCGRLMCCLRFEDQTYRDMKAELPPRGTRVWTAKGEGEIVDHQVLGRRVVVRNFDGERIVVPVGELRDGPPPPPAGRPPARPPAVDIRKPEPPPAAGGPAPAPEGLPSTPEAPPAPAPGPAVPTEPGLPAPAASPPPGPPPEEPGAGRPREHPDRGFRREPPDFRRRPPGPPPGDHERGERHRPLPAPLDGRPPPREGGGRHRRHRRPGGGPPPARPGSPPDRPGPPPGRQGPPPDRPEAPPDRPAPAPERPATPPDRPAPAPERPAAPPDRPAPPPGPKEPPPA